MSANKDTLKRNRQLSKASEKRQKQLEKDRGKVLKASAKRNQKLTKEDNKKRVEAEQNRNKASIASTKRSQKLARTEQKRIRDVRKEEDKRNKTQIKTAKKRTIPKRQSTGNIWKIPLTVVVVVMVMLGFVMPMIQTMEATTTLKGAISFLEVRGYQVFAGGEPTGHWIPAANDTWDLGSAASTWRDLYLGGDSLHLGNRELTDTGSQFRIDGVAIPRTATFIVAASNSSTGSQAQADYVCSGTADQVEIQAAIDACTALPTGGIVRLSEGNFSISGTINLKHLVSVLGSDGIISTVIVLAAGSNCDMMLYTPVGTGEGMFDLKNFELHGNKVNNPTGGYGINLAQDGTDCAFDVNIERIFVQKTKDTGFMVERSWSLKFLHAISEYSDSHGFDIDNSNHLNMLSCFSSDNAGDGYQVHTTNISSLIDCQSSANGGNGFVTESTYLSVVACQAHDNGADGFNTGGSDYCQFVSCASEGNTTIGFSSTAGSTYLKFIGCMSYGNTTDGFRNVSGNLFMDYTNCDAYANGGVGYYDISNYSSFVGCSARANTSYGFDLHGTYGFFQIWAYENTEHNIVVYCNDSTFSGCRTFVTAGGKKSYYIDRDRNVFQGCYSDGEVYFAGNGDYNRMVACDFATINDLGTANGARQLIGEASLAEKEFIYMTNTSGGNLVIGDVVSLKAVAAGNEFTNPAANGEDLVLGMLVEDIDDATSGYIQVLGKTVLLKCTNAGGGINIGDFLCTEIGNRARLAAAGDMAFAIALEVCAAADCTIDALIIIPRKI